MNSVTSPASPRVVRFLLALGALAGLGVPLTAQPNRFVVDSAGGAGSTHTDVQAAVDAAAPGAVILVRPGIYQPFEVRGKGVTIQNEERFRPWVVHRPSSARSPVRIADVPSGQTAALNGLTLLEGPGVLEIRDCAGLVTVEELRAPAGGGLSILDSSRVVVRRSQIWRGLPAIDIQRSRVTLEAVECAGIDVEGLTRIPASVALRILDADVTLVDCIVTSGTNLPAQNSLSADLPMIPIQVFDGSLELLGITRVAMAPVSGAGSSAIEGAFSRGSLAIGPDVVLQPSPGRPAYNGTATRLPARPALTVSYVGPGAGVRALLRGPVGAAYTIYLGVPGPAIVGGGVLGGFELVPQLTSSLASGVIPPSGPARDDRLLNVPNDPALAGASLGLQAWVASTATTSAALSNLAATVVR